MTAVEELDLKVVDERYRTMRLMRPDMLDALRRSIERRGVLQPIVVNVHRDDALVVLDGFKRIAVLRERGAPRVMARLVRLDDEEAEAAILAYNRPHRGLFELEEAWIVESLARKHRLTQVRIAELVGRHKSWVCRRLAIAERLDRAVQDDLRLGLLAPTVARELILLPRGNQAAVAHAITRHQLSTRQAQQLVNLWRGADDGARAVLLDDPVAFIGPGTTSPAPPKKDPRLSDSANAVRDALLRLEAAASRFGRLADQHLPMALDPAQTSILSRPVSRAHTTLSRALDELEALLDAWKIQMPEP